MPRPRLRFAWLVLLAVACVRAPADPGLTRPSTIEAATRSIDDARLRAADRDSANWLTHGRTYAEERFSPLRQIHAANVGELGLVWSLDLGTKRGLEATPIVVDGILFLTGTWSVVHAVDARTGELIWSWDPWVPKHHARFVCCDVVNRGVAVYRGRVYAGTLDGRLAALEAATGEVVWEVVTVDQSAAYSITGAPRIVNGRVIIGNGGAEFGVRGYVSAYDADSGELIWRSYTVPGDPSLPFESEAMKAAAATWSGEWWEYGGGGTAWDAIVYDPGLDLLYVGTGNGSPWNRHHRSPGGGDNLYLSSVLALRPDDGALVWHYQTTPGEMWDFTATQPLILAELEIDGRSRRVIMQAPKNGFFYVLDRETGELLSAEPYVEVTWATGVDPATGRPIETAEGDYGKGPAVVKPSPYGGHNWHPMAYNPETGLVYLPIHDTWQVHAPDPAWRYDSWGWNTGTDVSYSGIPETTVALRGPTGALLAWDPVQQREVWRVSHPLLWNGGVLATAGNLVFQGTADGRFVAYRATDGEKLWEAPTGSGVIAGAVSYLADAVQYVTVLAGFGGPPLLFNGPEGRGAARGPGRVLTYAIGGTATLEVAERPPRPPPVPAVSLRASMQDVLLGARLYHFHCMMCHGIEAVSGGAIRDLRYASAGVHERFEEIVQGGLYIQLGMPGFGEQLTPEDVRRIQAYVLSQAATARNASEDGHP